MKNLIRTIATALVIMLFLTSCGAEEATPKLHSGIAPLYGTRSLSSNKKIPEGKELTSDFKKDVEKLFQELCAFYGVKKELPEIKMVSSEELKNYGGDVELQSFYDFQTKTLYLLNGFSLENISYKDIVTHELLHYLSDNGEKRGLVKQTDEKEFNKYLNEGVTEYLAEKFVGKNFYNTTPYLFQMFFVEELVMLFGEDTLEKAYFSSDDSELRQMFNTAVNPYYKEEEFEDIKYDAFDYFSSSFYTIWFLGVLDHPDEQYRGFAALQEELIFAAKHEGKIVEIQKYYKKFLKQVLELNDSNFLNQYFAYDYLMSIK